MGSSLVFFSESLLSSARITYQTRSGKKATQSDRDVDKMERKYISK